MFVRDEAHKYSKERNIFNVIFNKLFYILIDPFIDIYLAIGSKNREYIQLLNSGLNPFTEEVLSTKEKYNEYIFTSLRTSRGIILKQLAEKFGNGTALYFKQEIKKWIKKGFIINSQETFILTISGKLQADIIASDLFII